jgi:hypothetical protein
MMDVGPVLHIDDGRPRGPSPEGDDLDPFGLEDADQRVTDDVAAQPVGATRPGDGPQAGAFL